MSGYLRATTVEEALAALAERPRVVLAGATDLYPARVGRALDGALLDIGALAELRGVEPAADGGWRIGALATWAEIARAALPPAFAGLQAAAREVGGPQIQNVATIGGNLCNASPAADGIPNLLVLEAEAELRSQATTRRLPVAELITGNRRTARRADELLVAVHVPAPPPGARATFRKLGARRYLVISIVAVAALLAAGPAGTVAEARLAVGACSPVARRLPALEAALRGRPLGAGLGALIEPAMLAPLAPIDDHRASAGYRLEAAAILLARALDELGEALRP